METALAQQGEAQESQVSEGQQAEGTEGQEGAGGQPESLEVKFAKLEERYKHSSEEGKRLYDELKKERESKSSLKSGQEGQAGLPALPNREQYIKWWTESGDKTEKEAAQEYERETRQLQVSNFLIVQNQAVLKRMDLMEKRNEQGFTATVPQAKEAQEFFKDIPEIAALPVADQVNRYQAVMQKKGMPAQSRDTSGLKTGLSPSGGAGAAARTQMAPELDTMAKDSGFPSYQAMLEFNKCETQRDHETWKAKWEKKK